MSNVVNLLISGTPRTLFTNALAESEDIEVALIVMLSKDGKIRTDWTQTTMITAFGLIEMLRIAITKEE